MYIITPPYLDRNSHEALYEIDVAAAYAELNSALEGVANIAIWKPAYTLIPEGGHDEQSKANQTVESGFSAVPLWLPGP